MNADQHEDDLYRDLINELVELRKATAEAVGRRQYAYEVLDEGVETGHHDTMRRARLEFEQIDDDTRLRIEAAAGLVT